MLSIVTVRPVLLRRAIVMTMVGIVTVWALVVVAVVPGTLPNLLGLTVLYLVGLVALRRLNVISPVTLVISVGLILVGWAVLYWAPWIGPGYSPQPPY
jgi:hypothetical protein